MPHPVINMLITAKGQKVQGFFLCNCVKQLLTGRFGCCSGSGNAFQQDEAWLLIILHDVGISWEFAKRIAPWIELQQRYREVVGNRKQVFAEDTEDAEKNRIFSVNSVSFVVKKGQSLSIHRLPFFVFKSKQNKIKKLEGGLNEPVRQIKMPALQGCFRATAGVR